MKVVFDITMIGRAHQAGLATRSGISRVAEGLLLGLIGTSDCQLTLVSPHSFDAASAFLNSPYGRRVMRTVRLERPAMLRWAGKIERRIAEFDAALPDGARAVCALAKGDFTASWKELQLAARIERRVLASLMHLAWGTPSEYFSTALKDADIYHSPAHPLPPIDRGPTRVLTCHDLIAISHPEYFTTSHIRFVQAILESLTPDDWVLCDSESTRQDVYAQGRVDPRRTTVVYPAASREIFYPERNELVLSAVRRKYRLPDGPYFLTVNTIEPRKNLAHVIRAFCTVVTGERIRDLTLVLVGGTGWNIDETVNATAGFGDVKNRVKFLGYVPDPDLAALYSGAMGFLYMSFLEGFGLPPLEAMQCGVPVVCSNTSSLPEVVGEAGLLLSPTRLDDLCHAMFKLYRDSAYRTMLADRALRQSKKFSWEKCGDETVTAYRQALLS